LFVIFGEESEEEVEGTENLVTAEQVVHMSDQQTRQRGVYKIATYMKVLMLMRLIGCGKGKLTGVTVSVLFTNDIRQHLTK